MPIDLKQYGRYQLIRRISLGGMAEVYKAKSYVDGYLEKVVALKRLLPNVAEDADFVEMFLQEAKLAAQLLHPHIARIYELGKVDQSFYMTMEFIYGEDLRQVLRALKQRDSAMAPAAAAFVAARVADALDYAYHREDPNGQQLHIVHRDISPQNIVVGFAGEVKVIDFGIAKAATTTVQTAAGVLKGKYSYMSPEHAQRITLDERSDIWSLGVVLHEVLNGKRLFVGNSMADTVGQVLHRQIPRLTETPVELADIVERMLSRDIETRIRHHKQVRDELDAYVAKTGAPVGDSWVSEWMAELFPPSKRVEPDLTDNEVHVLLSAEEQGDETTDQQREVTSATEIFLADTTSQADYRAALERLIAAGRMTQASAGRIAVGSASPKMSDAPDAGEHLADVADTPVSHKQVLWDALWAAVAIIALTVLLL